jgi:regulator of nucleoside diphosphate kinase
MFFPIETITLTSALDVMLAVFIGLAPLAVTFWVKLMLFRRRREEDRQEARAKRLRGLRRRRHRNRKQSMKARNIIITATDHAKLSALLSEGHFSAREHAEALALKAELERAAVVCSDAVPPDVITMNSRAELLDLDSGERTEFTVVFPDEADPGDGKISVLAPVGAGMLGYRVGDTFEGRAPNGIRHLKVLDVTFQPEASFAATS